MKIAVVFLTLYLTCTLIRADEFGVTTCIQEMGLNIRDVLSFINNDTAEGKKQYGCLLACILKKNDAMVGNTFKMPVIEDYIAKLVDGDDKETVLQNVRHCIQQAVNDDECVAARQFIDCSRDHLDHMDLKKILQKVMIKV